MNYIILITACIVTPLLFSFCFMIYLSLKTKMNYFEVSSSRKIKLLVIVIVTAVTLAITHNGIINAKIGFVSAMILQNAFCLLLLKPIGEAVGKYLYLIVQQYDSDKKTT